MESFIVKEVEKRPIIYDKSLRAIEDYKEQVQNAFDDISREIENHMKVRVPAATIEKIWLKCVTNFKSNKDSANRSSNSLPDYLDDMLFMLDHLSHRESSTSGLPEKCNGSKGSIWTNKNKNKRIIKKGKKMPRLDNFAEKKMQHDQHLVQAVDSIQELLKDHGKEATCSSNMSGIDSDYFNFVYEKLAKVSPTDVDQCFIEILQIIDDFQKF